MAPKHPEPQLQQQHSVEGAATMSTIEGLGQLQLGARSSKIAPEMLWLATSSVAQTGSAATTGAIAVPSLPRTLRQCDCLKRSHLPLQLANARGSLQP